MMLWIAAAWAAPELVSVRPWTSPFEEPGLPPAFVEVEKEGRALEAGQAEGPPRALRLYLEEAPGEAWRGPLTVEVDGTRVQWPAPSAPRGVPDATIYEAHLEGEILREVRVLDGPWAGTTVSIGPRGGFVWWWLPLGAAALGGLGVLARSLQSRAP